jgi:hypothetical protein
MFLGKSIHLKELFIQPTKFCAGTCYKCYVKQHFSSNQQTSWQEQVKLVEFFLRGEEHSAEQISISIDELPDDIEQRYHMVAFVHGVLEAIKKPQSAYLTFTMQSPSTYLSYVKEGIKKEDLDQVDCLAFSDLFCGDVPFLKTLKTEKCFNWQMSNTSAISDFEYLLTALDYIYIIVPKYQNFVSAGGIAKIAQNYFHKYKDKLIIDVCLDDAEKFRYFKTTCSGGISKFQVWPDGSVSCCPYARTSDTEPGATAEQIIDNIRKAHLSLDFDKCPVLRSLTSNEGININEYRS